MADDSDQMLVWAYARRRCEQSFAELVRRHVNLVYSTALRIVREAALAEEVTQGAFLALAQHCARLQGRSSLTGWLYETTRNLSINTVRSEERRRRREGEAATMKGLIVGESQATWQQVAPHLDEAMAQLKRGEREVILWRYFEPGEEAGLQIEYNWADGSTTTGPVRFVRIGNNWAQALNFEPRALGKMSVGLQTEGAALANQPTSK